MFNPFFSRFPFPTYPYHSSLWQSQYKKEPTSPQPSLLPSMTEPKTQDQSTSTQGSPFLELFGMNLFFDDILLLCLIFFLYAEGIKDEMLFLSLILLLLS